MMDHYAPRAADRVFDLDVYELDENSPRCPTPVGANITLKPHQEAMLHRCIMYENEDLPLSMFAPLPSTPDQSVRLNGAVIGDRVGSGKTYLVLSLIKSNDITNRNSYFVKSFGMNSMVFKAHDASSSIKTNIIVIPHNIPSQWEAYIKNFGCGLTYLMINKTKIVTDITSGNTKIEDYDLVVVTSTFYKFVANYLIDKAIKVQRIIFDEVDNITISGCYKIRAMFYWYISASYGNLMYPRGYNSYCEGARRYVSYAEGIRTPGFVKTLFYELADTLPKELMKIMIVKNKEAFVEASFQLPPMITHIIRCQTPASIRILAGVVDRNIIASLNAGDEEGAIALLSPLQKRTESNIIELMINRNNKELKNLNTQLKIILEVDYDTPEERNEAISAINKKIQDVNNKIELIKDRINNNGFCSICYDDITHKTILACCQNSFCFKCISIWRNRHPTCPMCKQSLTDDKLFVVSKQDNVEEPPAEIPRDIFNPAYSLKYDKYRMLEKILKQRKADPAFKCLLFSGYDTSFTRIVPILEKLNIKFSFLKGRGDVVNNTVRRYKNGDVQVLLVNINEYGSGLNLENTSDVVMFHKFESQIEKQVIGRAQRMGRVGSLKLWYLLHESE